MWHVEAATAHDADAVLALLRDNALPNDGLADHWASTIVAGMDGTIVGSAALEIYGEGALLRSVAVAPAWHRRGVGHDLTAAALQMAGERRLPAVYLLTTTAEQFFPKFGFERIERADVPTSVQASVEFTSACPSSATVMRKIL